MSRFMFVMCLRSVTHDPCVPSTRVFIGTLSHRKTMFIAVQQHKYMGERSTLAHPSLPRSHHFLFLADVSANWGCS